MISSKMSSTSWRSQISRRIRKYSAVGVITPPVLLTGSRITPATVSGSSWTMTSSTCCAAKRLHSSQSSKRSR